MICTNFRHENYLYHTLIKEFFFYLQKPLTPLNSLISIIFYNKLFVNISSIRVHNNLLNIKRLTLTYINHKLKTGKVTSHRFDPSFVNIYLRFPSNIMHHVVGKQIRGATCWRTTLKCLVLPYALFHLCCTFY